MRQRNFLLSISAILCGVLTLSGEPSQAAAQTPGGKKGIRNADQRSLHVPAGTVLPVRLNGGFSSKNARTGQAISGRIMQDVPLPGGGKIPAGANAMGKIEAVAAAGSSSGARISFRFDQLEVHHRRSAMVSNLRALASALEVDFAQIPERSPDFGTPYHWATTQQVGGDERYGVGGPVTDQGSNTVGEGVWGGVLVHVRAQPGTKCRGALDAEDRLQALWIFSAEACGVYGMSGVTVAHAGRTEPVGEIVLASERGEIKVRSGSGMLLRVIR
jgi:hypothetical protein